jgi:DNA (cytosine-5)-methyltransferase 1
VVGVDIRAQPDYPFAFHQDDAIGYLVAHWDEFDVIHASPPCTEHSSLTLATKARGDRTGTRSLLAETLRLLAGADSSAPWRGRWIVENVPGARMQTNFVLCGSMFGLRTYRHRRFAKGADLPLVGRPAHPVHRVRSARKQQTAAWAAGQNVTVTGSNVKAATGTLRPMFEQALGIDWVKGDNLAQAIPPAYTECIGRQIIDTTGDRWTR